jgi:hypothetical protein
MCAQGDSCGAVSCLYETSVNLCHGRKYNLIKTIRLSEFRDAAGQMRADRFKLTNIVLSFLSVLVVVAKQPCVAQSDRGAAVRNKELINRNVSTYNVWFVSEVTPGLLFSSALLLSTVFSIRNFILQNTANPLFYCCSPQIADHYCMLLAAAKHLFSIFSTSVSS